MQVLRRELNPSGSILQTSQQPALTIDSFIDRLMVHGNFNTSAYGLYKLDSSNPRIHPDDGSAFYGKPVAAWLKNMIESPRTTPLTPLVEAINPQDIFNVSERGEHPRDDQSHYLPNDLNRLTSEIFYGLSGNDQTFSFNPSRAYYSHHQYSSKEYYFHHYAISLLHKLAKTFPKHESRLKQLAYEKEFLLCTAAQAEREFPDLKFQDAYNMSLKILSATVGEPKEVIEKRHSRGNLFEELNNINLSFQRP